MNFDYTIHPYVGVGPLRFGMTREQVAETYSPPAMQVEEFGGTVVDYYPDDLLSLSFDARGELDFIEWHASCPSVLGGVTIDGGRTGEIVNRIRPVAGDPVTTDAGLNFELVGVEIYAPVDYVEGVAAYREGYQDEG